MDKASDFPARNVNSPRETANRKEREAERETQREMQREKKKVIQRQRDEKEVTGESFRE